MRRQRGFTLIEVIVAMAIMAFLALFTVESIQQALRTKTKVQGEIDKNSMLRDALRVMERDINMAFNYRDINVQLFNMAQREREKAARAKLGKAGTGAAGPGGSPGGFVGGSVAGSEGLDPERFKQKPEKIETQFIGEASELAFTSLSNIRITEDSPISSQAEIGYKLKSCRRRSTQESSSQCLWRRISNYIHEDITKEGQETVLLENVTDFKLRYLGPGRDGEWVDTWISNERGDDQTKNKFPYAVEITIEIKDSRPEAKDKPLRMTAVAAIRNPNNPPKEEAKNEQLPIDPPNAATQ